MPINNITQTISELPAAGARGVDVQTVFVNKQEDFQDHLQGTTVTELNTLKDQLNLRIGEINSTATTMNGYADTATTKAEEASASASSALTSRNQASTFATNASNSASNSSYSETRASKWADNNYNVLVEAGKYSAKHWSTVAENTVNTTVKLTGNQTVAGVKTFTSSPIVPTPIANTQVANKEYVDSTIIDRIGLIDCAYVAKNYHIVAFGGEFNRADYPKLWAYLQANPTLVKTQAQWTTEATANGGICGFFSGGNGTTTFRVPNLDKAFLRHDSRGVGSYQGDAIRNITGGFNVDTNIADVFASGAFFSGNAGGFGAANSDSGAGILFDVSRVVPTANENRPKNIAVLPLIVAK